MIATALLAAVAVAVASYWLGDRWAQDDLQRRFSAIERSLADSSFPLNAMVLDTLADLTQTELVGTDSSGKVIYSTTELNADTRLNFSAFTFSTKTESARRDRVAKVEVLFDKRHIDAIRGRATILPLVTGLSTVVALTSVTLLLSSRLVNRVGKLQRRVELVASGDFESTVSDDVDDEIGKLGGAVDSMAGQLKQLWNRINRQQSEKLLHQVAGGMAHQLRNSLTGARMAVEMHAKQFNVADDEGIGVAIHQIEVSEDYVRRLLLVGSGQQDEDRPANIRLCFEDVRRSFSPIAKHLNVSVDWYIDDTVNTQMIQDGPTWVAAAGNLIHNAIQAGDNVRVELSEVDTSRIRLSVSDNGDGIPESVVAELFEPFVTSKPEGMGLGLSVVRRAAERLHGEVRWSRENDRTIFEFDTQR